MKFRNPHKTKIGIVLSSVPGYSETFFKNKIEGLQENGFEVILFVDYFVADNGDFPCKVVFGHNFSGKKVQNLLNLSKTILKAVFVNPRRSIRLFRLERKHAVPARQLIRNLLLNQFMLNHKLDWIHFGFGMLSNGRENVAEAIGAKMAVSFRGFDLYLSPLKHPGCYDTLFKKEVYYHVLSQGMKNTLVSCQIPENRIRIITPAINTDFFRYKQKPDISETVNILTVARLHWIKGLEYTLQALSILKEKGIKFKYTLIGEGELKERLVFAVQQMNLSDNVVFVGKLSPKDVRLHYETNDIYIQHSFKEGFCNAVLEAQAMGLLCIVSNVEALNENVLDRTTGWVVPNRDPQALAQKIIEIIELPRHGQIRITENAIERTKAEFNLENQNQAFYDFYTQ